MDKYIYAVLKGLAKKRNIEVILDMARYAPG